MLKRTFLAVISIVFAACSSDNKQTYADERISFQYPGKWKVDVIPQDGIHFYNIHTYNQAGDFAFTFLFRIEGPSGTMGDESKEELETSFNPSRNGIIRSEITKTASGENAFYMEFKNEGSYNVALFLPVGDANSNYSISGGIGALNKDAYQIAKENALLDIVKSMKINIK